MSNISKQRASTLIEVLIAVSVIASVLTAVSAMISMSIKVSDSNEKKQLALQKAQEALEFFRKERSINSWHNFSTPLVDGSHYCVSALPEGIASMSAKLGFCSNNDVLEAARYEFKREAVINFYGVNSVNVQIDMAWTDGSKAKTLTLQQSFENY